MLDSNIPSPLLTLGGDDDRDRVSVLVGFNERHFSTPVPAEVPAQVLAPEDREPVVHTVPLDLVQLQGQEVQSRDERTVK